MFSKQEGGFIQTKKVVGMSDIMILIFMYICIFQIESGGLILCIADCFMVASAANVSIYGIVK